MIKPLGDLVVVKRAETETKTASGLALPPSGLQLNVGEVIAIGPGLIKSSDGPDNIKRIPMEVKVGDQVMLGNHKFEEITIDGQKYSVLHQSGILGTFEKGES